MSRDASVTHKIMSSIHSRDTRPEMMIRKALFASGLRYRVNYKNVPGKPDIAFTKVKLAVFVDGDFWHGHNWAIRGYGSLEEELNRYSEYWRSKILRNIERDKEVDEALKTKDWVTIRFWESDLKKDLKSCVDRVEDEYYRLLEDIK